MKNGLGLILIGSSMAFVGCGSAPVASDQGEPSQGENAPSENAQGLNAQDQNVRPSPNVVCDCIGYFYCPATGRQFEYYPPRCGGLVYVQARSECQFHCSTSCVQNSGGC